MIEFKVTESKLSKLPEDNLRSCGIYIIVERLDMTCKGITLNFNKSIPEILNEVKKDLGWIGGRILEIEIYFIGNKDNFNKVAVNHNEYQKELKQ